MNIDLTFLYWADVLYNLDIYFSIFGTVALLAAIVYLILHQIAISEREEETIANLTKGLKKSVIFSIIFFTFATFCPSKTTIYAIGIANNINNNATVISETMDNAIDTIIEAAKELKKSSEDDD